MDKEEATTSSTHPNLDQQMSFLQELSQQQNEALLMGLQNTPTAPGDYLQHLQQLAAQMQQVSQNAPLQSFLSNSSLTSQTNVPIEELEAQKDAGLRNRRTFSGSGQTISQHTRDRLKNMIAQKKQRLYSSVSQSANVSSGPSGIGGLGGAGSASGSEINLLSQLAQVNNNSSLQQHNSVFNMLSNNPQFDTSNVPNLMGGSSQISDFQLRKVNSEPNLKMRLRARLLNKGSSPTTNPVHPYNNVSSSSTAPAHKPLQRCDSDSVSTAMDGILKAQNMIPNAPLTHAQSISNLPPGNNLVLPSPSLPNLTNNIEQMQLDLNNLMLQASFASFLSMPSLVQNPLYPNALLEQLMNRENATAEALRNINHLQVGGYQSLLKQQLRDLVLRRKSLVREEPEEENLMDTLTLRFAGQISRQTPTKTGLVYDTAMSKHQCLCGDNQNHVEHGGRVHSIWARLQECGLVDVCERVAAKKASVDILKLVHTNTYSTFFGVSPAACMKIDAQDIPIKKFNQLECGGLGVDTDTYFNEANTPMALRTSVGSLVELASLVAENKLKNGFACIRPPGHHAEPEQALGFCFFNNVAIAARYLQRTYPSVCQRIAIVDWDVHHGNGTQICFENDPNVLYISMHRHDNGNFFPGTGAVTDMGRDEGRGFTVNIPFSGDIMKDSDYLAAWRIVVLPLLDSFRPEFILVSAGFDGAKGHGPALGGYELSPKIFGYFTRSLKNYANGKVVLALEGGYDLPAICDSAEECVKALCADGGKLSGLDSEALESIPNKAAQETILKVIAVQKKNWPGLSGIQGISMSETEWQTVSKGLQSLRVQS